MKNNNFRTDDDYDDRPRGLKNFEVKMIQESGLLLPIHGSDCDDCQYRASAIRQELIRARRRWRRFMAEN
ncbi:MAG TPA: hypothetical protein VJH05_01885 [Candidatus Paceibacterota bacterium]